MSTATDQPTITLHWLEKSRSQRILWLIYELDIPTHTNFILKTYARGSDHLADAALKAIHPLGKSPVIEVQAAGQEDVRVIAESGAIVEYLCEHFGRGLVPRRYQEGREGVVGGETEGWLRYIQLMHYAEGSLMSLLVLALIIGMIKDGPQTPFYIKPITRAIGTRVEQSFLNRNLEANFTFIESQLATSPNNGDFLCGDQLSGADILMVFPLEAAQGRAGVNREKYPKICAYVERLTSRPAYKKAVQRIVDDFGKYELA